MPVQRGDHTESACVIWYPSTLWSTVRTAEDIPFSLTDWRAGEPRLFDKDSGLKLAISMSLKEPNSPFVNSTETPPLVQHRLLSATTACLHASHNRDVGLHLYFPSPKAEHKGFPPPNWFGSVAWGVGGEGCGVASSSTKEGDKMARDCFCAEGTEGTLSPLESSICQP